MKNSYLILGIIAIAAIAFVFYYMFMKSPKYSGWSSFADGHRCPAGTDWCKRLQKCTKSMECNFGIAKPRTTSIRAFNATR